MSIVDSTVQVAEGVGKFLRMHQRSIGGTNVQIEGVQIEDSAYAVYSVTASGISLATANSHLIQFMAGAGTTLYLHLLRVYQLALATVAAIDELQLFRLTTAGTGGVVAPPQRMDNTDAVDTFTAMTLPAVKGAEGANPLVRASIQTTQTVATQSGGKQATLLAEFDWTVAGAKKPRVNAGAANGFALKNPTARAAATVVIYAELSERNH